ncbi:hypothetical protein K470DRAFT_254099 [Piedraia hortae CBS 480.64]|uniref:RING-type domain-containing protein n=1 Tax=Piedraia hortae CBS 480.64 TaxID=1314780 RepID=A0A6A7CBB8_9PEZI|nr:hypothetical protein K470DRAFT_254099 [Piedraia hortae CBS 480.64]
MGQNSSRPEPDARPPSRQAFAPMAGRPPTDSRRRSLSANRLSQLLHRTDSPGPDDLSRGTSIRRTATRFRNLVGRRSTYRGDFIHTGGNWPSQEAPRYTLAAAHDESSSSWPSSLPSIDVPSSLAQNTFGISAADDGEMPPRLASSSRLSGLRRNSLRPDRSFRHLASQLRRRRSPSGLSRRQRGQEDQVALLSRILSAAATATAATLIGDDQQALAEARSLTGNAALDDLGDGEDGSFEGFLRALQNGRIASALRQGTGDMADASQEESLNFFRMFRFGSSGSGSAEGGNAVEGSTGNRMVPIIIVGIRSISVNSTTSLTDDLPPFIDALGDMSTPDTDLHDTIDSILHPPRNSSSFRHRRRASMGGLGLGRSRLSDRLDNQRDQRSPDSRRDRWSVANASSQEARSGVPASTSVSAELSRMSSRTPTSSSRSASFVSNSVRDFVSDSRRHSMLNRISPSTPLSAQLEEATPLRPRSTLSSDTSSPNRPNRQRRAETTPNVHYPRFASGHPRRNGVVEPDNLPPLPASPASSPSDTGNSRDGSDSGPSDSRSWIIYVLGGSYPENHPILTTPSLFTENPTYEDMMLLSALLGPARAPVASDEDVDSAGGLYNIERTVTMDTTKMGLVAVAAASDIAPDHARIVLDDGQRCLVCLCDYEVKEVGRRLVKCGHLFHKECIDQWLTQGRNSCPLCRGQGVEEYAKPGDGHTGTPSSPAELAAS